MRSCVMVVPCTTSSCVPGPGSSMIMATSTNLRGMRAVRRTCGACTVSSRTIGAGISTTCSTICCCVRSRASGTGATRRRCRRCCTPPLTSPPAGRRARGAHGAGLRLVGVAVRSRAALRAAGPQGLNHKGFGHRGRHRRSCPPRCATDDRRPDRLAEKASGQGGGGRHPRTTHGGAYGCPAPRGRRRRPKSWVAADAYTAAGC